MIFRNYQLPRVGKLQFRLRHLFALVTLTAIAVGLIVHFNHGPAAPRIDQGDFDLQPVRMTR
jgi:hypothetical protein